MHPFASVIFVIMKVLLPTWGEIEILLMPELLIGPATCGVALTV